jgi:hypothetical protein
MLFCEIITIAVVVSYVNHILCIAKYTEFTLIVDGFQSSKYCIESFVKLPLFQEFKASAVKLVRGIWNVRFRHFLFEIYFFFAWYYLNHEEICALNFRTKLRRCYSANLDIILFFSLLNYQQEH